MMLKIEVEPCPVCEHKLHLNEKCPGQIIDRKLPENPTIYHQRHKDAWTKNLVESTDYSFLAERNKTPEMREASRKVGLKTGPANFKKAHAKYDGKKWCNKCKGYTKHVIGIGCMTCWNSSDKMRNVTSERNRKRWATDPEYAKRIAANLGEYLNGKKPYLEVRDQVHYFRGELCQDIVDGLLDGSKSFDNYPQLELRNGKICYNKIDILTEEKVLLNRFNFHIENDVKMYKDKVLSVLVEDILSGKEDNSEYPGFSIRYNHVCYNGRDVLTDEFLPINSFFTTIDDILYYKQEPVEDIVNGLLDGTKSFNDYPNFNNRFGRICYGTTDLLTEEVIKFDKSLFTVKDNVEFCLNFEGKYEVAEEFFTKYEERMKNEIIAEAIQELIDEEGFNLEPIICDQNSETWSRSRTDKYLCDKGYGWLTYVKLLDGKPFIVGKTSTQLVSASQIDFDFLVGDRESKRYCGLGREFVRRTQPGREYTDFDKVLVKGFETEEEALDFEAYIYEKYQLFMS